MAMSGFCRSKHSPKVATLRRRPMRALRDTRRVCPTPAIQVWYPGFRFAHPGYLLAPARGCVAAAPMPCVISVVNVAHMSETISGVLLSA